MGLYFILNRSYSYLIGGDSIDKKHEKASKKRDKNHPHPGAKGAKGQEKDIKEFAKDGMEYPHFLFLKSQIRLKKCKRKTHCPITFKAL